MRTISISFFCLLFTTLILGAYVPVQAKELAGGRQAIYVVKRHDTLGDIGYRFRVNARTLYAANKAVVGDNPHLIFPGQRLVIPIKPRKSGYSVSAMKPVQKIGAAAKASAGNGSLRANIKAGTRGLAATAAKETTPSANGLYNDVRKRHVKHPDKSGPGNLIARPRPQNQKAPEHRMITHGYLTALAMIALFNLLFATSFAILRKKGSNDSKPNDNNRTEHADPASASPSNKVVIGAIRAEHCTFYFLIDRDRDYTLIAPLKKLSRYLDDTCGFKIVRRLTFRLPEDTQEFAPRLYIRNDANIGPLASRTIHHAGYQPDFAKDAKIGKESIIPLPCMKKIELLNLVAIQMARRKIGGNSRTDVTTEDMDALARRVSSL